MFILFLHIRKNLRTFAADLKKDWHNLCPGIESMVKKWMNIVLLLVVSIPMLAANSYVDSCMIREQNGDTLYMAWLHEVWVYPPMRFRNKKQEKFYWRTVRDVKKCLPYAKMITKDMAYADGQLAQLTDNKARRKWWRKFERQLFRKYEKDFRNMYASQGRMLMLLMDRETDRTSYELIKQYKGKAAANFWQFVAKLFRNDLKEEYDASDKDKIVERVINLVEAGQL